MKLIIIILVVVAFLYNFIEDKEKVTPNKIIPNKDYIRMTAQEVIEIFEMRSKTYKKIENKKGNKWTAYASINDDKGREYIRIHNNGDIDININRYNYKIIISNRDWDLIETYIKDKFEYYFNGKEHDYEEALKRGK